MNPKSGLIGLFILTFFLSGIGMAILVDDDKKDLSSRAALGTISNLRPALPEERSLQTENVVEVQYGIDRFLSIEYNAYQWIPPRKTTPVFYHRSSPATVRLTYGEISFSKLQEVIGTDFTSLKYTEDIAPGIEGWSVTSYSGSFFGTPKVIDVWTGPSQVTLIAVMSGLSSRPDVFELAKTISIESGSQVKGINTPDDTARLAALVRPSVVMIVNNYCATVKSNEKSYPYCLAQGGSGFFVNEKGYIATNGHVVSNIPETSLFYAVESGALDAFLIDYFQDYLSLQAGAPIDRSLVQQKVTDLHKNKESIYQMAALVQDLFAKKLLKIENSESHYFVQLGNTPIQISKSGVNVGKDVVAASLIASDYAAPDPTKGFTTSDVAILKIEGKNYPALPLGSLEDISVGSDVLLVGFPGVVMGSNSLLLDTSANAEPTFTKGVVSSFKQAKGNKKNLIQTDASINHGNSGGPALSSSGKVIGIATYGLVPDQGGGNYNFLRDIADLKDLMVKNKIFEENSSTYTSWKDGLNNYWVSYFKYAIDDFEKVTGLYPAHQTVGKYMIEANAKIGSIEDKTPKLSRVQRKLYINLSGGAMTFSILMIIVLSISGYIDSKRRRVPVVLPPRDPMPPRPIQTF